MIKVKRSKFNRVLALTTVSPFALIRPKEGWAPKITMAEPRPGAFKPAKGKKGLYDYNP